MFTEQQCQTMTAYGRKTRAVLIYALITFPLVMAGTWYYGGGQREFVALIALYILAVGSNRMISIGASPLRNPDPEIRKWGLRNLILYGAVTLLGAGLGFWNSLRFAPRP